MRYRTLILERGVRGRKLKEPVTIRVPERQSMAEKRLLRYIVESLSGRSRLIPFVLRNQSTMKIARHLLFNRTGSPFTFFLYINELSYFSEWMRAEPDQLMEMCRKRNGDPNPKGMLKMACSLDKYIDHLKERAHSPNGIMISLRNITIPFRINGVRLKLPFGLSVQNLYEERAPTREELIKVLDLADLRERVVITILAVSGLRVGTLLKLQYRHVKNDLEHGIIPIHVHVEAGLTKGKRRKFDTFLNEEASDCLKAYVVARKKGTRTSTPEEIHDESPLIRARLCKKFGTVTTKTVHSFIHDLYVRAGLLEKYPKRRRYELRTHSLRKFFRTQMASLGVDSDCIDYMMGRAVKDRYHDVSMKGVEYLRGVYMTSGIRIRPRIKMNKIDALKEILQTWGLDPQKILSHEALAQITPTTNQEQANDRDLAISTKTLETQNGNALL